MNLTEFMGLLAAFATGFGTVMWRIGRMEARINGTGKDLRLLKEHCPVAKELGLCEGDK